MPKREASISDEETVSDTSSGIAKRFIDSLKNLVTELTLTVFTYLMPSFTNSITLDIGRNSTDFAR